MAFCTKCGHEIGDNVKFCPSCGAPVETSAQTAQNTNQSNQTDFSAKVANLNNTADSTADFDAQDIQNNKAMAILAYLSWLVLIPLFAAKESKFARFHCNQGIILAIAEAITIFIFGILSLIPYLGIVFMIIEWLVSMVWFGISICGILNAANGKAKALPIFGKFKILK